VRAPGPSLAVRLAARRCAFAHQPPRRTRRPRSVASVLSEGCLELLSLVCGGPVGAHLSGHGRPERPVPFAPPGVHAPSAPRDHRSAELSPFFKAADSSISAMASGLPGILMNADVHARRVFDRHSRACPGNPGSRRFPEQAWRRRAAPFATEFIGSRHKPENDDGSGSGCECQPGSAPGGLAVVLFNQVEAGLVESRPGVDAIGPELKRGVGGGCIGRPGGGRGAGVGFLGEGDPSVGESGAELAVVGGGGGNDARADCPLGLGQVAEDVGELAAVGEAVDRGALRGRDVAVVVDPGLLAVLDVQAGEQAVGLDDQGFGGKVPLGVLQAGGRSVGGDDLVFQGAGAVERGGGSGVRARSCFMASEPEAVTPRPVA
jgi:hypothetical protein